MVTDIRLYKPWEASRRDPVELSAVNDDAAERGSMAADELRRGMHDDIRAVIERTQLIRRSEGTVDNERNLMLVRDFCHSRNIDEIGIWIADGLDINDLRIFLHCIRKGLYALRRVHKGGLDAKGREGMLEEIVGTAINGRSRNDMLSGMYQSLQCVGYSRRAGCCSQRRHAALKSRKPTLEHILRRIREAAIDITRILQSKAIRRMLRIVEHIRSRLVNRHRTRIRRRIRLFLAYMKL